MNKNILIAKLLFKEAIGAYYTDPERIEERRNTPAFQAAQAQWNAAYKGPTGGTTVSFEYAAPNQPYRSESPYMSDSPAMNQLATAESARADRQAVNNGTMSVADQTRRMAPQGRAAQYYAQPAQVAAGQLHQAGPASKGHDHQVERSPEQVAAQNAKRYIIPVNGEPYKQNLVNYQQALQHNANRVNAIQRNESAEAKWAQQPHVQKWMARVGITDPKQAIDFARRINSKDPKAMGEHTALQAKYQATQQAQQLAEFAKNPATAAFMQQGGYKSPAEAWQVVQAMRSPDKATADAAKAAHTAKYKAWDEERRAGLDKANVDAWYGSSGNKAWRAANPTANAQEAMALNKLQLELQSRDDKGQYKDPRVQQAVKELTAKQMPVNQTSIWNAVHNPAPAPAATTASPPIAQQKPGLLDRVKSFGNYLVGPTI